MNEMFLGEKNINKTHDDYDNLTNTDSFPDVMFGLSKIPYSISNRIF